mmetsp:Transcript_13122/g.41514  ORF Transcript_13122/g.41514 Transcript_13122/m.41514 type:complete len:321 (-) Transcript_13122:28-990(-)
MQPGLHKHRSVLVPRAWRHPGGGRPLPPPVPVPREAVRVAEGLRVGRAPTAEEQEPIPPRRRCRVHARRGAVALWLDLPPVVRLLAGVKRPRVREGLPPVVAAHRQQEVLSHEREGVGVAGPWAGALDEHPVPARVLRIGEVEHVEVVRGKARWADASLDNDHASNRGGRVRGAWGWSLASRVELNPRARLHIEAVHVRGGTGQPDSRAGGVGVPRSCPLQRRRTPEEDQARPLHVPVRPHQGGERVPASRPRAPSDDGERLGPGGPRRSHSTLARHAAPVARADATRRRTPISLAARSSGDSLWRAHAVHLAPSPAGMY